MYILRKLVICGLILTLNFAFAKDSEKKPEKKDEKKLAEVFVQNIKVQNIKETSEYPITLKSRANSKIKSTINGVVVSLAKKLGEQVKAGEVLATLKQQSGGFDYKPLKLKSPINGQVTNINVNIGEYVNIGDLVIEVIDPKLIFGRIEVPVRDHSQIKKEQTVEITLNQLDDLKIMGVIEGISYAADPLTGTLSADVSILDKKLFPIGIVGKAKIFKGEKSLILLQESALNYKGEQAFVKVVDDKNIVSNRDVKVGTKKEGKVEILKGLEVSDQVIIRSNGFVALGDQVNIVRTQQ